MFERRDLHKWQYEHAFEEYECAMQYLDDLEIPRGDNKDMFSLVGRIKELEKKLIKQSSEVEDYYLKLLKNDK